ncbi:hypothetical protein [Candidatus Electrothrix sp.]|uniref:hypothetical protein n=1 Tax=Candidatus Electrothrix sp. TaxID=2170559 RepID=UPI004055FEAE
MTNTINFPTKIDKFIFNDNNFIFKSKKYNYCNIESLRFFIKNVSINFSKDEYFHFSIRMVDDSMFELHVGDAMFSINKKKVDEKKSNMKNVFDYLNKKTFSKRLESYLNQLKEEKYISYKFFSPKLLGEKFKTVKIYNDGNVVMDNRIFNVKKARQEGTLKFGTAYGFGCDKTIDPYEISINEKKPILGGRVEGADSMRIDGSWDYPIIFEILKSLS